MQDQARHTTPTAIVHKDTFPLMTTIMAAGLNLTSVFLVLFGVMGKIDRGSTTSRRLTGRRSP